MSTVGFLGLGSMGGAMATRLVEAGHEVRVWNRSKAAVNALADIGAVPVDRPEEALAAEVSFSMLANDKAATAVLSETTLIAAQGNVHVNMASISPAAADELARRAQTAGVTYVAAPVLGRPNVAAAGQLNILVAGPPKAVELVEPYLLLLGKRTWRFGDTPRQANAVKVAVNYNLLHTIQALGESMTLVERQGVDPEEFSELLSQSLFGGVAWTGYSKEIAQRAYTPPGFTMAMGRKDLGLAEDLARESDVFLPVMATLRAVFDCALATEELAEVDWGGAAEVTRRGLLGQLNEGAQ